MMFCPDCGSILTPKKIKVHISYTCKCGFSEIKPFSENVKIKENPKHTRVEVIDDINRVAVHDHICVKCGYDKAEIIDKGQMYSDEDDVILFKCGKCGHIEMLDNKVK